MLNTNLTGFIGIRLCQMARFTLAGLLLCASPAQAQSADTGGFGHKRIADRYIVSLHTDIRQPALSARNSAMHGVTGSPIDAETEADVVRQVFAEKLNRTLPDAEIHRQFTTLLNGLEITADADARATLASMPEVNKVYPVYIRYATLDASHEVTDSVAAWQRLGEQSEAGRGVRIAIIDSGINPAHPMFSGDAFAPTDLSDNQYLTENPDYCRAPDGDPGFCNNKIIVARWIDPIKHALDFFDGSEAFSPLDTNRHGSHVAGIAAGNPISIDYQGVSVELSGVAPGANLMVYKALYASGGVVRGTDSMLLEALEHAVNDGADVINNSWGSLGDEDAQDSVYAEVFNRAEQLGVVIVSSAGNSGAVQEGAINCPGCIPSGLAVANSTHGRFFGHALTVGDTSWVGIPPVNTEQTLPASALSLAVLPTNSTPADPLPASLSDPLPDSISCINGGSDTLSGAAVLVDYQNTCPLTLLIDELASSGASLALVYTNETLLGGSIFPFEPYDEDYTIPVLGLSPAAGAALQGLAQQSDTLLRVSADKAALIDETLANRISPDSSRGPNGNPDVLKPDIAAPGKHILSAAVTPPEVGFPLGPGGPAGQLFPAPPATPSEPTVEFALISGTSMASPQVAGAAALMRQTHPDWTSQQIKTALTSSAQPFDNAEEDQLTPFDVGSGLLNIPAAMDAVLTFERGTLANGACIGRCVFTIEVSNVRATEAVVQVDAAFTPPHSSSPLSHTAMGTPESDLQVTVYPQTLMLSAAGHSGDSASVTLTIDSSAAQAGEWNFGGLTFSSAGASAQRVPVAVFANDNSDTRILSQSATYTPESKDVAVTVRVRNLGLDTQQSLSIPAPEGAKILADSVSAEVSDGLTDTLDVSTEAITWQGQLAPGNLQLNEAGPPVTEILTRDDANLVVCSGGCYEFAASIPFEFDYAGVSYTALTVSSNGFAVPGRISFAPFEASMVQAFPQDDGLNNVLAPLWSTYDLLDPNLPGDEGGGQMLYQQFTRGDADYLIVQWDQVEPFGADETGPLPMTFQLILSSTGNVWFNYLEIPVMPSGAVIGAENSDGSVGVVYAETDPPGRSMLSLPLPDDGLQLALEQQVAGVVEVKYRAELVAVSGFTAADTYTLDEDTAAEIDVLSNDPGVASLVTRAMLNNDATNMAERLAYIARYIAPETLEVVSAPQHGSVSIEDDTLKYVPDVDYYGEDSLDYRVASDTGEWSAPTTLTLTVAPVNDMPTITSVSKVNASKGQAVVLRATAEDIDMQSLTYDWQQVGGEPVAFLQLGDSISFVIPEQANDTLSFAVTANDGVATSEAAIATVTVQGPTSGGAAIWSLGLLMGAVFLRLFIGYRGGLTDIQ